MGVLWTQPARVLVDGLDGGFEGLWSLVFAAQHGALRLALDRGMDDDLSLTLAAMDLGEALEDLEWAHPDLPAVAVALDLGPVPADAVSDCRAAIAELLAGALDVAAEVLRDSSQDLDTPDVLCLARVVHLLSNAHLRVTGRMP
jgi:hypothetical protein